MDKNTALNNEIKSGYLNLFWSERAPVCATLKVLKETEKAIQVKNDTNGKYPVWVPKSAIEGRWSHPAGTTGSYLFSLKGWFTQKLNCWQAQELTS